jgi:NAD(P)-dependent dehydrogenase (short-subunit alcohol dehydrogenase family)
MNTSLKQRGIVIIGASGGIGSKLAEMLAEAGANLFLVGRNTSRLAEISARTGAESYVLEGSDFNAYDVAFQRAKESLGAVYGVVNCAGSLLLKPAHTTTEAEYQAVMEANLHSAFAVVRSAAKVMMESAAEEGGSIVLMSSAAARTGLANHEAIAAAKAGVIGLTLSAAASYAGSNLRINAVAPGLVRTPMTEKLTSNAMSEKFSLAMHALGRLGEPEDVASLIFWLLNPANHWVTGQVFGVDGGLGTVRPKVKV